MEGSPYAVPLRSHNVQADTPSPPSPQTPTTQPQPNSIQFNLAHPHDILQLPILPQLLQTFYYS